MQALAGWRSLNGDLTNQPSVKPSLTITPHSARKAGIISPPARRPAPGAHTLDPYPQPHPLPTRASSIQLRVPWGTGLEYWSLWPLSSCHPAPFAVWARLSTVPSGALLRRPLFGSGPSGSSKAPRTLARALPRAPVLWPSGRCWSPSDPLVRHSRLDSVSPLGLVELRLDGAVVPEKIVDRRKRHVHTRS